jgi:hypothetical protein
VLTHTATLDLDPTTICWRGEHLARAIFAIFSISFTTLTVTVSLVVIKLVLVKTGKDLLGEQATDFQYSDRYLIQETSLRLIYSCMNILFSAYPYVTLTASIITNIYLYQNNRFQGTSIQWMNSLRCCTCALVVWTGVLGLILFSLEEYGITFGMQVSLPPLLIGWAVIIILSIFKIIHEAYFTYRKKTISSPLIENAYFFGFEDEGVAFYPRYLPTLPSINGEDFRRQIDSMLQNRHPLVWEVDNPKYVETSLMNERLEYFYVTNKIRLLVGDKFKRVWKTFYLTNSMRGNIFDEIRNDDDLDITKWDLMEKSRCFTIYETIENGSHNIYKYDYSNSTSSFLYRIPDHCLPVRKICVRWLQYKTIDRLINKINTDEFESLILTKSGEVYMAGHLKTIFTSKIEIDIDPYQTVKLDIPNLRNGEKAIDISAGVAHYLVRTNYGYLYALGSNEYGQCGTGSGKDENKLQRVDLLKNVFVKSVYCGQFCSVIVARGRAIKTTKTKCGFFKTYTYDEQPTEEEREKDEKYLQMDAEDDLIPLSLSFSPMVDKH